MSLRSIFSVIQILFLYTANPSELCNDKFELKKIIAQKLYINITLLYLQ